MTRFENPVSFKSLKIHDQKSQATPKIQSPKSLSTLKNLATFATLAIFVTLVPTIKAASHYHTRLDLSEGRVIFRTSPNFLSFAIDSSHLKRGMATLKLTDPALISLTKHLSPAYFRIGGIAADRLLFIRKSVKNDLTPNTTSYFTGDDWLALHNFTRQTNTRLLFDLNVLHRTELKDEQNQLHIDSRKSTRQNNYERNPRKNGETGNLFAKIDQLETGWESDHRFGKRFENDNQLDSGRFESRGQTGKHWAKGTKRKSEVEYGNGGVIGTQRNSGVNYEISGQSESQWDSSNAADLLKFCEEQGLSNDWQLGNEPNAYLHKWNTTVSPEQLARDYRALKSILSQSSFHAQYLLIGPEVTRPNQCDPDLSRRDPKLLSIQLLDQSEEFHDTRISSLPSPCAEYADLSPETYLDRFLAGGGRDVISGVGFHQYYLDPRADLDAYLSPATFEMLRYQISVVRAVVDKNFDNHEDQPPIWLSETGSCVAGGRIGLTDSFASSFLWIDKLGLAARLKVWVVIRQSLEFGNYALLDYDTLTPNPDWWLSVLYKRLVDPRVLDIFLPLSHPTLRLYAQCSPSHNITVFGINSGSYEERLYFNEECDVFYYGVNAASDDLKTKDIVLNHRRNVLKLKPDGSLPDLDPIRYHMYHEHYIPVAPYSVVFMEIVLDRSHACNRH